MHTHTCSCAVPKYTWTHTRTCSCGVPKYTCTHTPAVVAFQSTPVHTHLQLCRSKVNLYTHTYSCGVPEYTCTHTPTVVPFQSIPGHTHAPAIVAFQSTPVHTHTHLQLWRSKVKLYTHTPSVVAFQSIPVHTHLQLWRSKAYLYTHTQTYTNTCSCGVPKYTCTTHLHVCILRVLIATQLVSQLMLLLDQVRNNSRLRCELCLQVDVEAVRLILASCQVASDLCFGGGE